MIFSQPMNSAELHRNLSEIGYGEATIQQTGKGEFFIRTQSLELADQEEITKGLEGFGGSIEEFDVVSPMVSKETLRNAFIAVIVACVAIFLYVAWAFRRMPRPFSYGSRAIIALVHDILVVIGVFSFLARALDWEVDPMFMAALLAVLGYSINNTTCRFDIQSTRTVCLDSLPISPVITVQSSHY